MRPKQDLPPGSGPQDMGAGERPTSRNLLQLRRLWAFVRPYRLQVLGATGAVAVAAGMFSSTLLTLVVVPVFYVALDDAMEWARARLRRLFHRSGVPSGAATP